MSTIMTISTPLRSSKKRRHNYLLLEILISLALLSLCFAPLIAPQLSLLTAQRKLINAIEYDRIGALVFIGIKEQMYNNTIPLESIPVKENKKSMTKNEGRREEFDITETYADGSSKKFLGYSELFQMQKVPAERGETYHLIIVTLYFCGNTKSSPYQYTIMATQTGTNDV